MERQGRAGVVLAAAVLCVAACGTTVPGAVSAPAGGDPLSAEPTQPAALELGGGPGTGAEPAAGRQPVSGSGGSAGQPFPSQVGAPRGGSATGGPAPAPGGGGGTSAVTTTSVRIGFVVAGGNPGTAAGGSVGFDEDTGTRLVRAYVDQLNATGGLAGRKVEPAFAYVDNTDQSTGTQTRLQNEACVKLTEDDRVFAAISMQPVALNFAYDCFATHRTPLIDANLNGTDQARFDQLHPWLIAPVYVNFTRMARLLPQALKDQGFLTKKMAIIGYNRPDLRRSAQTVLVPAIAALGGKVIDQYYLEGSYDGLSSGTANAALKFNTEGVDRVVMWAPGGGALIFFARQAESQGYRPRYGVTTYDAPALTQGLLQSLAPQQLAGAAGLGFLPASDLADAQSGPLNDREKECFRIARERAGQSFSSRRQANSAVGVALAACELTRFLQHALRPHTGLPLVPRDLAPAAAALGSSYVPAVTPASSFSRAKLDGAGAYSHLYFADDCDCFRYRGQWRRIPT